MANANANAVANAGGRLSSASPYEMMFQTRHRPVGRPVGALTSSATFLAPGGVDPLLVSVAKKRATAVMQAKSARELRELFLKELAVLRRRGVARVAADIGVDLHGNSNVSLSSSERG